jgi:hypothetical protein
MTLRLSKRTFRELAQQTDEEKWIHIGNKHHLPGTDNRVACRKRCPEYWEPGHHSQTGTPITLCENCLSERGIDTSTWRDAERNWDYIDFEYEYPFRPGDVIEHNGRELTVNAVYFDTYGGYDLWEVNQPEKHFDLMVNDGESSWSKLGGDFEYDGYDFVHQSDRSMSHFDCSECEFVAETESEAMNHVRETWRGMWKPHHRIQVVFSE